MEKFVNHNSNIAQKTKGVLMFLLLIFFGLMFSDIFIKIFSSFNNSRGLYSILIICISLFLIWERRFEIYSVDPHPAVYSGSLLTFSGLLVFVISHLSNTLILQGIAMIVTTLGLILLVLSWRHFNILLIPVLYLSFAFYFFEEVLGLASIYLQNIAAQLASVFLKLFNIPVIISGIYLEMPHITLEVARVCNGVNHIVALVALSFPVAIVMFSSMWLKFSLVILAFFTGIVLNGLRVALIGVWTLKFSSDSVHGPLEILYVSFILGVGILFIAGVTFIAQKFGITNVARSSPGQNVIPFSDFYQKIKKIPLILATIFLSSAIIYTTFFTGRSVELSTPLTAFPANIDEWVAIDIDDVDWPIKNLSGDYQLRRLYSTVFENLSVGMAIAYFSHQKEGNEIINKSLTWLHNRESHINLELNDGKNFLISRGKPRGLEDQTYIGDERYFYFFYYVNGKALTNIYQVKFEGMLSELKKKSSPGAMVIFSTESDGPIDAKALAQIEEFVVAAIPMVMKILNNQ